jgi:hypothetical protein
MAASSSSLSSSSSQSKWNKSSSLLLQIPSSVLSYLLMSYSTPMESYRLCSINHDHRIILITNELLWSHYLNHPRYREQLPLSCEWPITAVIGDNPIYQQSITWSSSSSISTRKKKNLLSSKLLSSLSSSPSCASKNEMDQRYRSSTHRLRAGPDSGRDLVTLIIGSPSMYDVMKDLIHFINTFILILLCNRCR